MTGDKNITLSLQFGDWSVFLHPSVDFDIRQFDRIGPRFSPFFVEAAETKYSAYMIFGNRLLSFEPSYPNRLPKEEFPIWDQFRLNCKKNYQQYKKVQSLLLSQQQRQTRCFTYSWPESETNEIQPDLAFSQTVERFSCLICPEFEEQINSALLIYNLLLAARWHVRNGGLCLHASAVERNGRGFLFLGESQAGKSTIAQLGMKLGSKALGDDINFVTKNGVGFHLAAGPSAQLIEGGYSPTRPVLRGIFTLVKDTRDVLFPLSTRQVAQALYDGLMQSPPGYKLTDEYLAQAIHTIGDIARSIPGYELHFRKSPDFWKLIDAEFPD